MTKTTLVYSYSKCGSCKKAINWLKENNINYRLIDIIENPPSKALIAKAIKQLGDSKYLFNTSGASYREIGSSTIKKMSIEKQVELLGNDSKLIKRPFLISNNGYFLTGFKPKVWEEHLSK